MLTKSMPTSTVPTHTAPPTAGSRTASGTPGTAGSTSRRSRTPAWFTLAWAVVIGALSVLWMTGVLDFPFGEYGASLLDRISTTAAQILMLASAALGLAIGTVHLRRTGTSRLLAISTLILPLVLIFAIPDWRVLAAVGYTPIVIVAVISGLEPITLFANVWAAPTLILFFGMVAGLCFTILAVRSWPNSHRANVSTPRLITIGRISAYVAALIPIGYATTRVCWALGIPLGISRDFLHEIRGITIIGLGLALFAIVGAILTLGLTQHWGTVFPRWIPRLRGKPVPVNLAVVPALVVSVLVGSAGVGFVRDVIAGDIAMAPNGAIGQIAAWLPEMFWPLWGAALATAALVYRERRRRCAHEERQERLLAAVDDRRTPPSAP